MSQSKWKELPVWKETDDYAFLGGADNPVWAWEALRREKEYREDWKRLAQLRSEYVYHPPKKKGETEQQWMRRIAYKTDSDPIKKCKAIITANKWGLEQLHNPEHPFSHEVRFIIPKSDFPHFIRDLEDLDKYFETAMLAGRDFQQVIDRYAVVVLDKTRHITPQLRVMDKILRQKQDDFLQAKTKAKIKKDASQKRTWLRHIRVLDALRSGATQREIALALGGKQNKSATPDQLRKQGKDFVDMARKMAKTGYRAILTYKGSPYT